MLTAYAASTARLIAQAGVDIILVGDSLGNVFQGKKNTLSVTLDEMIYHGKAVRSGAPEAFVVVDLPFMSFQVSPEQTLINAGRVLKETDAQAVKLEGASDTVCESIRRITDAGIPVIAHLGFTPQSVNQLSGYKIQGKTDAAADRLLAEAERVQSAGAFALVLEMVPAVVAKTITQALHIPVISCGAGPYCDGQVLVIDDVLGLSPRSPKFAKQYISLGEEITNAVMRYVTEVKSGIFPGPEQSF
jgi:3-methyl-2-oxobutanoate hydroxymethyltransferase